MQLIQTPEDAATFEKLLPLYLMALGCDTQDTENPRVNEIKFQLRKMARAADKWYAVAKEGF